MQTLLEPAVSPAANDFYRDNRAMRLANDIIARLVADEDLENDEAKIAMNIVLAALPSLGLRLLRLHASEK